MQKILFIIISLFFSFQLLAQWEQTNGPEGAEVFDLEKVGLEIWAATDAGLFISDNNGATWEVASFLPLETDVRTIYKNDSEILLYVSSFDYSFIFADKYDHYLYRSLDNGVSWVFYELPFENLSIFDLPHNIDIFRIESSILIKLRNELYRSDNNGNDWVEVTTPPNTLNLTSDGIRILAADPQSLFLSNDKGVTWQFIGDFGTYDQVFIEGNRIIVYNGSEDELYISENLGNTWTSVEAPVDYTYSIKWKRGTSGKLYFLDRGFYSSDDNGYTWDTINTVIPSNVKVRGLVELSNDQYLAGTATGFFNVANDDQAWSPSNGNLVGTTAADFKTLPSGDILASTGLGSFQTDNGVDWFKIAKPPASVSLAYSMVTVGDSIILRWTDEQFILSTDNLNTFDTIVADISIFGYFPKFKHVNDRFYLIGRFSFQSDDLVNWDSLIIDDLDSSWPHRIDDLIATEDGALLASVDGNNVHRSTDNGVTWDLVFENPSAGARPVYFYKIADRIFIVGIGGWYASIDHGLNWSPVSMNGAQTLNGYFPTEIAHTDHVIFASLFGTGVYRSNDLGEHWELYNSGIGNLRTFDIHYSNGYLYYGSFAGGVWRREVENDMVPTEEEFSTPNYLEISPNPVRDHAYLSLAEEMGIGTLEFYDTHGRLIRKENLNLGQVPRKVNLIDLPPGFYSLKYFIDGKYFIGKLIVH